MGRKLVGMDFVMTELTVNTFLYRKGVFFFSGFFFWTEFFSEVIFRAGFFSGYFNSRSLWFGVCMFKFPIPEDQTARRISLLITMTARFFYDKQMLIL